MLDSRFGRALVARLRAVGTRKTAPTAINWDLTYACPLRCGHCYSESGRRPSRQLPLESLLHIADEILALRPIPTVTFSGGEPLVVRGVLDVARRLKSGGARTSLYTSGFRLKDDMARGVAEVFDRVAVSLDGPDAPVNDFLRERAGAFDEAMRAAETLDALAASRPFSFGLEITIMRTNWATLDRFATDVVPRLPHLSYLHLGALIPTGLASRATFVDRELLDEGQMAELPALERRLRRASPRSLKVRVFSNLPFLMHPRQVRWGTALDQLVKIEADGRVRGMDIYEGTVGSVLTESLSAIFPRTRDRHSDPFVVRELSRVKTMQDWASACRAIDLHFASTEDRARIDERQLALPVPAELTPPPRQPASRPLRLHLLS
jgi:MoaA/NifB/PqqE/SkfB family radical SAM enzyme